MELIFKATDDYNNSLEEPFAQTVFGNLELGHNGNSKTIAAHMIVTDPHDAEKLANFILDWVRTKRPLCKECNQEIAFEFDEDRNQRLREDQLCFSCDHWIMLLKKANESVRIDGGHFMPGPENSTSDNIRGMGGRLVRWIRNGEVESSTNMWCQGDIPDHFKDRLPDNAIWIGSFVV